MQTLCIDSNNVKDSLLNWIEKREHDVRKKDIKAKWSDSVSVASAFTLIYAYTPNSKIKIKYLFIL